MFKTYIGEPLKDYTLKEYTTKVGKKIYVYDNLFDLRFRDSIFAYVSTSLFQIGWHDSDTEEGLRHKNVHSRYSPEDNAKNGFMETVFKSDVAKHFAELKIFQSIVNLSTPSDINWVHAHPEKLAMLYYVNLTWRNHWYGETLFFSEDEKEIEVALPYTPGRLVVFDAGIPHTIRPQSTAADQYRFTFSTLFA
jgi:hypothetical protein